MDQLDKKIILELMKNSRIPLTSLSKKIRTSREVITYRINKLKNEKTILSFVTDINTKKLGFISASVFINISAKKEREFEEFIKKCNFTSWSGEFSGVWRFGLDIYGRTNEEIHSRFQKIFNMFKEDIIDHRLTIYKDKYFFHEKYLGNINHNKLDFIGEYSKIDKIDKQILIELAKNSRIESVELSRKINLTSPAIAKRIKELEKKKIITKYSLFIDVSKLNLFQYSIFITNKNLEQREKLLTYLSGHSKVPFIAEYIGDPFLEFGLVVENPYELRKILQEIEESFPENKITEVFLIQEEFLSIGPPLCIFE